MAMGDAYRCGHCQAEWVWGEGGRDEYCATCTNPHHESNRILGCQVNIDCVVIEDFGRVLDRDMDAELQLAERRERRRKEYKRRREEKR